MREEVITRIFEGLHLKEGVLFHARFRALSTVHYTHGASGLSGISKSRDIVTELRFLSDLLVLI